MGVINHIRKIIKKIDSSVYVGSTDDTDYEVLTNIFGDTKAKNYVLEK